jgi:hypothetical protein
MTRLPGFWATTRCSTAEVKRRFGGTLTIPTGHHVVVSREMELPIVTRCHLALTLLNRFKH